MKYYILKDVYEKLLSYADLDYETGGVIGFSNGIIIDLFLDTSSKYKNEYHPNIDLLNKTIENWAIKEISFIGIFHNHLNGCSLLSDIDINYFREIIKLNDLKFLLCPLIFKNNNKNEVIIYKISLNKINKIKYNIIDSL